MWSNSGTDMRHYNNPLQTFSHKLVDVSAAVLRSGLVQPDKLGVALLLHFYFCGFHAIFNSHHPYQMCNVDEDMKAYSIAQGDCTNSNILFK